jgi:hypothetical protein
MYFRKAGLGRERSSFTEDNLIMYECVFHSWRLGDSRLVPSELSINKVPHGCRSNRFSKGKLVLVLVGCALFNGACADDSTADNTSHRKHRHGSGHGREQSETVDRSGDSSNSTPASTPGW